MPRERTGELEAEGGDKVRNIPEYGRTTAEIEYPQIATRQRTAQELPPAHAEKGQIWVDPVDGAEMVYVPAGEFLFGVLAGVANPYWPPEWNGWPRLQRRSLLGFWIDRWAVTNERYRKFVTATGYPEPAWWHQKVVGGEHVVPQDPEWQDIAEVPAAVMWQEANDFCCWTGKALPTEEEWEKAARGTDGRRYPWGNEWPEPLGGGYEGPRVDPYTIDISPYGCVGMMVRCWTSTKEGSLVMVKGYGYPSDSTGGIVSVTPASYDPRKATLWGGVLREPIHPNPTCPHRCQAAYAFRCVLRGGGEQPVQE